MINTPTLLDVSGETCPLPLLRTKKQLKTMALNQILKVISTDPNTKADIQKFCQNGRGKLLDVSEKDNVYTFLIERI